MPATELPLLDMQTMQDFAGKILALSPDYRILASVDDIADLKDAVRQAALEHGLGDDIQYDVFCAPSRGES
jgi:hypothetical protein